MKYCKDCKHYRDRWFRKPLCGHEEYLEKVTGKPTLPCKECRQYYSACGTFAKLFEQAEPGVIRKSWSALLSWVAKIILKYV